MAKKKKINYEMGENIHDDVNTNRINWFPGHMRRAIREIKERLKMVDIVLEIRDARSPLVTGNAAVHQATGEKSRLIVINKTNLADPEIVKLWIKWFSTQATPFVFVNCFDVDSLNEIVLMAKKVVHDKRLLSNPDGVFKDGLKMMVLGLPNTGKSTIINKLAKRNATKVADKPGQTRQQLWVNIDNELRILDTPGVMPPKINKHEHGLWLAALNAIPDRVVESEVPACFIVEHLLESVSEIFKEKYKFDDLKIDLITALNHIATIRGCMRHKGEYDYDRVYKIILSDFRSGSLGLISFGLPPEE